MKDYGSCSLFTSYQLLTGTLNETNLRSDVEPAFEISEGVSSNNSEFLLPNTYCAVAADKVSTETVWFIKINNSMKATEDVTDTDTVTDDYSHTIPAGNEYLEGCFLEKHESSAKGYYYKLDRKKTFFYCESVVYAYVQFKETKKGMFISNIEYVEMLNYVNTVDSHSYNLSVTLISYYLLN